MDDDLFGDAPAHRKVAVTGRRRLEAVVGESQTLQSSVQAFDDGGDSLARPEPGPAPVLAKASSFDDEDEIMERAPAASDALHGALTNSWDADAEEGDTLRLSAVPVTAPQLTATQSTTGTRRVARTFLDADGDESAAAKAPVFDGTSRRKQLQMQEASTGGVSAAQHGKKYAVEKELVLDDIPEMMDSGKQDITHMVADAPKVVKSNIVQRLDELDDGGLGHLKHILQNMQSQNIDIDISLLTQHLISQEHAAEPDVYWDEEILLTEVASDLQREREEQELLAQAVVAS